ncbi:hypothetical protein [Vulcanisaeta distributa]|uniref:Uncharacterized protein n=1 Tax=Vulcanisaeta distributa (strain DSM 14429 / JCM 11212 / NBRC 100878 / IC-017) TaxID=572478 RepID=E1QS14_VULDI|nr:hypothetical protein [Vulcanisaeta distributa]ADN50731.1 hypothetical protein Vdis_1345 [Vulcanisaeta distributa DSM 14429]
MSRRARKKEEGKEQSTASITSFLYGTEEKPKSEAKPITKPAEVKAAEAKAAERAIPQQPSGIEDAVLNHIMSRGVITKDELMAWGKSRGLRIADILRAIESLSSKGRIRKRLNDKGNLVYEYVK